MLSSRRSQGILGLAAIALVCALAGVGLVRHLDAERGWDDARVCDELASGVHEVADALGRGHLGVADAAIARLDQRLREIDAPGVVAERAALRPLAVRFLALAREQRALLAASFDDAALRLDARRVEPAAHHLLEHLAEVRVAARETARRAGRLESLAFALASALALLALWLWLNVRLRAVAGETERATRLADEARFRALVQSSSDAFLVVGADDRVTYASPSATRVTGWSPEQLTGQPFDVLAAGADLTTLRALVLGCRGGADERATELKLRRRDGDAVPVTARARDHGGEPGLDGVVLVVRDISARWQAEHALREYDHHFIALFESSPQPMWLTDLDTLRFVEVNPAAVTLYGWTPEEFQRMTLADIRPAEDLPALLALVGDLAKDGRHVGTRRHARKDGALFDVEVRSFRIEHRGRRLMLALITDVTERRRIEEDLRQTQKMEAVGRLAGGVAHDFNNVLTAVQGFTSLLRDQVAGEPRALEWCDEILRASQRAATLTRQLLAFSRPRVANPLELDLNAVLTDVHRMLQHLLGDHVDLVTSPGVGLGPVLADAGQLEQIVLNLAVNARDAMPEGGLLTIETAAMALDAEQAALFPGLAPGVYVQLAVADTGCGMSPEVRARIFEPFFTTKPPGKGTGLGLATVYAIVKQCGGAIAVQSAPGEGTTFRILLPRAGAAAARAPLAPPEVRPAPATDRAAVLVVEDDERSRERSRMVLEAAGIRVLEAARGAEALALLERDGEPLDLAIVPLEGPAPCGAELARRVAALRPGARVLYLAGPGAAAPGGAPALTAPFTPGELLEHVRAALDTPGKRAAAA